jgi:cyclomaltodextrinase
LRRRQPWLHRATTTTVHLANEALIYDVAAGADRLRVALNLADEPLHHQALSGQLLAGATDRGDVPAHGWAVLQPGG